MTRRLRRRQHYSVVLGGRMFYCWCFFLSLFTPRNLRSASADRRETLPRDRKVLPFDNLGPQIFGVPPPKKGGRGAKRAKFWSTSDNFKLRSRISPELMEIVINSDSCAFDKKSGEHWSTNNIVLQVDSDPPKSTFLEDIFRPLRGAAVTRAV